MRGAGFLVLTVFIFVSCVSSGTGVRATGSTRVPTEAPVSEPVQMPPMPKEEVGVVPVEEIVSPGEVAEPVPGGVIDWGARVVRARGSGVVDPGDPNPARARLMAERAAVVVAQRNLLEILKGVRVDADTRVENFVTKFDVIYTHLEGIVKGARQVGPAQFDSASGVVEVELEVNLVGAQSVAEALAPALGQTKTAAPEMQASGVREFFQKYSALVFDAGNSGLKPSLFPKIYDSAGNLLLDTKELYQYTGTTGQKVVHYIGKLDEILSRPEFANQPLVLKVKQVRGKLGADMVLSKEDADKLKWIKDGARFLLDAGRLLIKLLL